MTDERREGEMSDFEREMQRNMGRTEATLADIERRLETIERHVQPLAEAIPGLMTKVECAALHRRDERDAEIMGSVKAVAEIAVQCKAAQAPPKGPWPKDVPGWFCLVREALVILAILSACALFYGKVVNAVERPTPAPAVQTR